MEQNAKCSKFICSVPSNNNPEKLATTPIILGRLHFSPAMIDEYFEPSASIHVFQKTCFSSRARASETMPIYATGFATLKLRNICYMVLSVASCMSVHTSAFRRMFFTCFFKKELAPVKTCPLSVIATVSSILLEGLDINFEILRCTVSAAGSRRGWPWHIRESFVPVSLL